MHIHERDSIESYLVSAEAFTGTIRKQLDARDDGGPRPDVREMQDLINDATEDLKDDAADRIANALDHWYAKEERRHLEAGELGRQAREIRDAAWGDVIGRLKFVPGKRLLARCRELVKRRYGVTLSNQGLLAFLNRNTDIGELVNLIRRSEEL